MFKIKLTKIQEKFIEEISDYKYTSIPILKPPVEEPPIEEPPIEMIIDEDVNLKL